MSPRTSNVLNKNGEKGEALLANYLTRLGYECFSAPPKRFPDWDIKAITPEGRTVLIEVKLDVTGMFLRNKNGFNFYIEMFNTKQFEPSGIFKTKSDKYAYFFLMPDNTYRLYVFKTRELRNFLCENVDIPTTGNSVEGNAAGWLLPNTSLPKINHTLIKLDREGEYVDSLDYYISNDYSS